jgi:hypothetical protein
MCQSHDVYVGQMTPHARVNRRDSFFPFPSVAVKCTVCLSCGFVAPYVGEDDLKKVRAWKAGEMEK